MESSALILDEDVATQFVIEQSLQDCSKHTGLQGPTESAHRYPHPHTLASWVSFLRLELRKWNYKLLVK